MKRFLIELLLRALRDLLPVVLLTALTGACNGDAGGGTGSADLTSPSPLLPSEPPAPESVTLRIETGRNFECLLYSGEVFCRGVNPTLTLNAPSFVRLVSGASPVNDITTFDDTLCFEASVTERPWSRTPGLAMYCIGEGTLSTTYNQFPLVYSGPPFSTASHGTASLTWAVMPFVGGDISLNTYVNQTNFVPAITTDGTGFVTERDEECIEDGEDLICETFTVSLQ